MDGGEMNAEQRRLITGSEPTNSHESPPANSRWSESLSRALSVAAGNLWPNSASAVVDRLWRILPQATSYTRPESGESRSPPKVLSTTTPSLLTFTIHV